MPVGFYSEPNYLCEGGHTHQTAWQRQNDLQKVLTNAKDAETILQVVEDLEGRIMLSTALHRLGRHGDREATPKDPRFHQLLEKVRQALPLFGARQLANALHGLGTLTYRGGGSMLDLAAIQVQRRAADFEPQHVSNTLWACAKMRLQQPSLVRTLLVQAIEGVQFLEPLDYSLVTWACATLKHRDVEWCRAVVRARPSFSNFSPQQMANFVWGMATLSFRNEKMLLALGREAAPKLPEFKPQELSNYIWALATLELVDNLLLHALSNEIHRRIGDLASWDPQSIANMMWAYAALAVKDHFVFRVLVNAAIARAVDFDCQELANSVWASAMIQFRDSIWLGMFAALIIQRISKMLPLNLAQISWAYSRFNFPAAKEGLIPAISRETQLRLADFPSQSLLDVHDALVFFNESPEVLGATDKVLHPLCSKLEKFLEDFAELCSTAEPSAEQIAAYRAELQAFGVVTLGAYRTESFLSRIGLLATDTTFALHARKLFSTWRAEQVSIDPTGRSAFHRSQCVWRVEFPSMDSRSEPLAGIFESSTPLEDESCKGLVACGLRYRRGGDAEFRALCTVLNSDAVAQHIRQGAYELQGCAVMMHVSEVPCVSCLGAIIQFNCRYPGVLRISFDRGRETTVDTVLTEETSVRLDMLSGGNYAGGMLPPVKADRFDPALGMRVPKGAATFYGPAVHNISTLKVPPAGSGVQHEVIAGQQTFYLASRPIFLSKTDYDRYDYVG